MELPKFYFIYSTQEVMEFNLLTFHLWEYSSTSKQADPSRLSGFKIKFRVDQDLYSKAAKFKDGLEPCVEESLTTFKRHGFTFLNRASIPQ